jgi:hypothetical protein
VRSAGIIDDPLRGTRRAVRRLVRGRGRDHQPGEPPSRILVGGGLDVAGLAAAAASLLGESPPNGTTVRHAGLLVTVAKNDHVADGDVSRWPLAIELAPVDRVDHGAYVETVTVVLTGLWERDLAAVAFCGFADELPRRGSVAKRHTRQV